MVEVETIIAVILVAANVILALAAVAQLRATNRSEARRLQPLVRARQQLPAPYHPPEWGTRFGVHLTNDGVGKAFNVRYGVRVDGVEYPSGPGKGNRHHLDAKENLAPVVIDVPVNAPTPEEVRKRAVLYARFEDVIGNVWETQNPIDLRADLEIRRVRFPRVQELRQTRRRRKADRHALPLPTRAPQQLPPASSDPPG